jgi:hypothetical protein
VWWRGALSPPYVMANHKPHHQTTRSNSALELDIAAVRNESRTVFRFSHAHDAAQVLHDGKGRVQGEVVCVVERV